jgi:hypothetical protein
MTWMSGPGEPGVDGGVKPAVPVADQVSEPVGAVAEVHEQVAGLLSDPGAGGVGGDPGDVDAAAAVFDDDQTRIPARQAVHPCSTRPPVGRRFVPRMVPRSILPAVRSLVGAPADQGLAEPASNFHLRIRAALSSCSTPAVAKLWRSAYCRVTVSTIGHAVRHVRGPPAATPGCSCPTPRGWDASRPGARTWRRRDVPGVRVPWDQFRRGIPAPANSSDMYCAAGSSFSTQSMPLPWMSSVFGPGSWKTLSTRASVPP